MQAFQISGSFGLDSLKKTELPDPVPGANEVLVRIHAASLNFRDLMMVQGLYNPNQPLPLIPLSDGAGEVVAVGSGVRRVQVGDRVMGSFVQDWVGGRFQFRYWRESCLGGPLPGMLAEYALLSEHGVVPIPDFLTYTEAATLPCAAVTAWNALVVQGSLTAGESVLLLGTGGVSLFALQFARLQGARVLITSSSDDKLARAQEMGAAVGINYRTIPDWEQTVREQTGGEGVDHVVEVGGAGTLPRSLRATRPGGQVHVIGVLSQVSGSPPQDSRIDPTLVLSRALQVRGVLVGSREMFEQMNRAITVSGRRPVVDRVFSFAEAVEALRYLQSGAHFGKVVIQIAEN
ncbi:MAG: NAD(P)-dependent alcohol dehydrogenase [Armatimonadaceae bacterium]